MCGGIIWILKGIKFFVGKMFEAREVKFSVAFRWVNVTRASLLVALCALMIGCTPREASVKLFELRKPKSTGLQFTNNLEPSKEMNIFNYMYFYNGGGVAVGDVNNDGLSDVYLTANQLGNKLFLNTGDLRFEEVTDQANVGGVRKWSTGVSMVDVNGDGWLDIYVCNSGIISADDRKNELFINQKDGTFIEEAAKLGLADNGNSVHASFFDYDLDGDLDCYILNNSFEGGTDPQRTNIREFRGDGGGDRFYRNEQGLFVEMTAKVGIYGSEYAYGLGIAVNDVNNDGYPDIYISNDFLERDYLYINQQDGTFLESITDYMNHTSKFSMGSDISDVNNDGWNDVLIVDMLPSSDRRLKTTVQFDSPDLYNNTLENGYYHQHMRNTLQLNNANGTFSDLGLFSGIAATDWSWSPLVADYNNDRKKDLYIANGLFKDITDLDFTSFVSSDEKLMKTLMTQGEGFLKLIDQIPSEKLNNFMFSFGDNSSLRYEDVTSHWGLDIPSFSNGTAYSDLDNDGDLDIIVNNVNQEVFLFENHSDEMSSNHFLKLRFKGSRANSQGIGAQVVLSRGGERIYYHHYPIKGFQSSMDYQAVIGLGDWDALDSCVVIWPGGNSQILTNPSVDLELLLEESAANSPKPQLEKKDKPFFQEVTTELVDFKHEENEFLDFDYDRLLMHLNSEKGPAFSVADLNGDGLDDFYIGGASNQPGELFMQNANGYFDSKKEKSFLQDSVFEDVDSKFFDADGDGDLDLYVVSGGSERGRFVRYTDRLYINTGDPTYPKFQKSEGRIPTQSTSGSSVEVADYDGDGDMDLFVGRFLDPKHYGQPVSSVLLENREGIFKDVTSEKIPQLRFVGMVTDAVWYDYDKDEKLDLILVGEWMPITIFKNRGAGFQKITKNTGLDASYGLWNTIEKVGQGEESYLIAGNLGLNSRFQASDSTPFMLYINDFDGNGTEDHVYAKYDETGRQVPFSTKQDLTMQMPYLKKKYLKSADYAEQSLQEIFGESLERSQVLRATTFASVRLSFKNGRFEMQNLPDEVQYSLLNAVWAEDFDNDSITEIVLAGNFSGTKPELGNYDASYGVLLKAIDDSLEASGNKESGLRVRGDVKRIASLRTAEGKLVAFARNDRTLKFYKINQ